MPIVILSDKEKLEKWNAICLEYGWSQPGELFTWIKRRGVRFTSAESCLAPEVTSVLVNSDIVAASLVAGSGEVMATRILEVYCGFVTFISTTLEAIFWKAVIERMSKEFSKFMPPELIPKYIRDILKYPADNDGSLPT